jgi:cytoskeletal protein CcmA (bactofilin family)
MFKQENKGGTKDAETVIGPSVMVKGNLNSSGNIIIEGILKGGIKTAGEVYVGDKAQITADVEAKTARIGGEIRGNLNIQELLYISSTAKIFGDINCASLAVEQGAVINGKFSMGKDLPVQKVEEKEENEIEEKIK